jgi:hypothetical protein
MARGWRIRPDDLAGVMQLSALIVPERYLVPGFPISYGHMGPRSG